MSGHATIADGEQLVEARHLSRRFVVRQSAGRLRRTRRVVTAVDDISFGIRAGDRECCAAQLTYVYTGGDGDPTPVPPDVRTALS